MPRPARHPLPAPQTSLPALAVIVREMRQGRLNVATEVTLLAATTETVLAGREIGLSTVPVLVPTSSAGAALAWWVDSRGDGSITLGHAAPGSDEIFLVLLIG